MSDCSEIDLNDNQRLLVQTTIKDQNNDPISGIETTVYAKGLGYTEIIGRNVSDENGDLVIITLSPSDEEFIEVVINGESNEEIEENSTLEKIIYQVDPE
ncbi:hypothetical protein GCM10009117_05210 [Gangjinia marincola]|uniref:Uncharacterized protein n=2 Tax=Gangjinia marincola TaxID=578463 RepID=A0ABN1ME25_9FLAO